MGVDSENAPQRGQFLPDSQPHSGAMGQEDGKKWAAAAHSQPAIPKSDRLLGRQQPGDSATGHSECGESALQSPQNMQRIVDAYLSLRSPAAQHLHGRSESDQES
ncbi:MAG: hypothetical protein H5U28_11025 [Burkholderiaceae bacterium]|nr:hypothetical protein [Burkholderiaceae bacterium]